MMNNYFEVLYFHFMKFQILEEHRFQSLDFITSFFAFS